jgi:hypothetical protein
MDRCGVDTSREVGDADHLNILVNEEAADCGVHRLEAWSRSSRQMRAGPSQSVGLASNRAKMTQVGSFVVHSKSIEGLVGCSFK